MAKVKNIRLEKNSETGQPIAIIIDWDNDRHHRVEMATPDATGLLSALVIAKSIVRSDLAENEI